MSGVTTATALTAATLASTAIGAGMTAYGAIQQGNAASSAAQYQAQVANNNAIISKNNAKYEQEKGEAQENQMRAKTAAFIGSQVATQSANGLDVNSGTNVDLRKSSATLGEEDALTIRSNTAHNVQAYEQQASNFGAQANLDEFNASESSLAGYMSGAGSIIGGAGTFTSQWSGANLKGINLLS